MVWFDSEPLDPAGHYLIKHTAQMVPARVESVEYRVNVNTLHAESVRSLSMNEVGVVHLATARPIFFDPYRENRGAGAFILIDRQTNATAAAGMIISATEAGTETPRNVWRDWSCIRSSRSASKLTGGRRAAIALLHKALQVLSSW
jgi:sulfate adenylyltransferase subunit 1 (EFTu-like GTPase family)